MKKFLNFIILVLLLTIGSSACDLLSESPALKVTVTPTPTNTSKPTTATSREEKLVGSDYDSIHQAAEYGDTEAVKWYLENGVLIDSKDPEMGGSSLHWAASFGRSEVVLLLLENNAKLTIKDSNGATPLHLAAETGQLSVCSILVKKDISLLYEEDKNGAMPIHIAAWNGKNPVIEYFVTQGVDINIEDTGQGGTPLHWAAVNGQTSTVNFLLQGGAEPSILDNNGDTAQELAQKQNHALTAEVFANWQKSEKPAKSGTSRLSVIATKMLTSKQIGRELTGEALIITLEINNQGNDVHIFSIPSKQPYLQTINENQYPPLGILVSPLYLYGIPGGPVGGVGEYSTEVQVEKGELPEVEGVLLEIIETIWASWVTVDTPLEEEGGSGDHFVVPVDVLKIRMEPEAQYQLKFLFDIPENSASIDQLIVPYSWHAEGEESREFEEEFSITLGD